MIKIILNGIMELVIFLLMWYSFYINDIIGVVFYGIIMLDTSVGNILRKLK